LHDAGLRSNGSTVALNKELRNGLESTESRYIDLFPVRASQLIAMTQRKTQKKRTKEDFGDNICRLLHVEKERKRTCSVGLVRK
jgi:hypothetical protein